MVNYWRSAELLKKRWNIEEENRTSKRAYYQYVSIDYGLNSELSLVPLKSRYFGLNDEVVNVMR